MGAKRRKKKRKGPGILKKVFDLGIFLLVVLVLTYLLSNYVVERITVHNHSMESTLSDGDSVFIDKISYRFRSPKRFEIVVFKNAGTGDELVKRIIGLPHETIQIVDGVFFINGEEIKDVKGLEAPEYSGIATNPIKLATGEYFVVGDNRTDSIDSRYEEIGLVTNTRMLGRVFVRLFPINKFRLFK